MKFFKPFELPTGASIPEREVSIVDFGAVPCQMTEQDEAVWDVIFEHLDKTE